jgi:hypothetical protein
VVALPDNSGRYAAYQRIGWNIPGYHGAGADNGVIADRHVSGDYTVSPDPDIIADHNTATIVALSQNRRRSAFEAMVGRTDHDILGDDHIVADPDIATVACINRGIPAECNPVADSDRAIRRVQGALRRKYHRVACDRIVQTAAIEAGTHDQAGPGRAEPAAKVKAAKHRSGDAGPGNQQCLRDVERQAQNVPEAPQGRMAGCNSI